jgi:hypothetical protein
MEIRCDNVVWIHVAWVRGQWWALVSMVINMQIPQKEENLWAISVTIGFSRTVPWGVCE